MIPMIHYTLHQNQNRWQMFPKFPSNHHDVDWTMMARGKYNINCIYVIFVRKKYLYVKFVLIFAIHVNLFGYTCYKDVRVPIRCVRAHADDLLQVDLTFAQGQKDVCNIHLWWMYWLWINQKLGLTGIPVYCGNAS